MNTFVPSPGFDASRFKGTTLILPSVSIGNVPQLTTDLLLATLQLDRVGCIEDENVIPVLGSADGPTETSGNAKGGPSRKHITAALSPSGTLSGAAATARLSMSVEVFQSKDGKWTIIQQRSPTVHHRSHHYADNLVHFIKESEFDQVVLLASADGARRIDAQLRAGSPPVRYISSPAVPKALVELMQGLGIEEMERVEASEDERREAFVRRQEHFLGYDHSEMHRPAAATEVPASSLAERVEGLQLDPSLSTAGETAAKLMEKVPRIPHGGIARRLHSLCQEQGISVLTVVKFAMEGDNAPDAIYLANVLNAIFKVYSPAQSDQEETGEEQGWKVPRSWDHLYGNTFHQDMYQ